MKEEMVIPASDETFVLNGTLFGTILAEKIESDMA